MDCRILVIDDDWPTLIVVTEFLKLEGYTTILATSGDDTLDGPIVSGYNGPTRPHPSDPHRSVAHRLPWVGSLRIAIVTVGEH